MFAFWKSPYKQHLAKLTNPTTPQAFNPEAFNHVVPTANTSPSHPVCIVPAEKLSGTMSLSWGRKTCMSPPAGLVSGWLLSSVHQFLVWILLETGTGTRT